MHWLGFLRLGATFSSWIFGAFAFPFALAALAFDIYLPAYFLAFYYTYRLFIPAKRWPEFKRAMNLNRDPYCKSQSIIFEEGAHVPIPDTKVLVTVSPHGILTVGFNFLVC